MSSPIVLGVLRLEQPRRDIGRNVIRTVARVECLSHAVRFRPDLRTMSRAAGRLARQVVTPFRVA